MRRRARGRGLAGLAVVGAVVIGGVVAGWGVSPGESVEISPADVVGLRFPADWNDDATASAAPAPAASPASFALASAESRPIDADVLFTPHRMGALPAGTTAFAPMGTEPESFRSVNLRTPAKADIASTESRPAPQPETHAAAGPAGEEGLRDALQRRPARQHQNPAQALVLPGAVLAAGRVGAARHRLARRARDAARRQFARSSRRDRPRQPRGAAAQVRRLPAHHEHERRAEAASPHARPGHGPRARRRLVLIHSDPQTYGVIARASGQSSSR